MTYFLHLYVELQFNSNDWKVHGTIYAQIQVYSLKGPFSSSRDFNLNLYFKVNQSKYVIP